MQRSSQEIDIDYSNKIENLEQCHIYGEEIDLERPLAYMLKEI